MTLRRLLFCSVVSVCALSISASANDRVRKSPFPRTPLAAPHHASVNVSKKTTQPVKVQSAGKKAHFWSR